MEESLRQNVWLIGGRRGGKSRWLYERYVQLAKSGIPLSEILFLTPNEASAQVARQQILRRLGGIWGGRIQGIGGFLTDYARQVLGRKGHPVYPLHLVSRWRLYRWVKDRLPESREILTNDFLSLFDDWRKWNLDSSILNGISLSDFPADEWKQMVSLFGELRAYLDENHLSDLVSLANILAIEEGASDFFPSHLLVDDAHELNAATWPVVARLCRQATFALTMLPEGQLYEEVADVERSALRALAHEELLGKVENEPLPFANAVQDLLDTAGNGNPRNVTLLRAASPFEELLQGVLWSRERSASERVVVFLAAPSAQLELLLEAAAWLDLELSLQGNFWSHWFPSLGKSTHRVADSDVELSQSGLMPASFWRSCLLERFRESFQAEEGRSTDDDSALRDRLFEEALQRGLLCSQFNPSLRIGRGVEVTTLERPDLAANAHVWVLGLSQDSMPGALPQNAVFQREPAVELQDKLSSIGRYVQLQLARPMTSLFGESRRKLLSVLSRADHDVLISYPLRTSDGQPVAESPFFRSLAEVAGKKKNSAQISFVLTDAVHPISFLKTHPRSAEKRQIPPRRRLSPFPIPVTALVQFIQCPRRFYYEQLLKLEVPERPAALLVGLILHSAMAHFLAPGASPSAPEPEALMEWTRHYMQNCSDSANLPEGVRYSIERFVISALAKFFESDVWQGEIKSVEEKFEFPVPGGFCLKGRIDRMDLTADGLEVIDYKSRTSFGAKKFRSEFLQVGDWIQFPVYVKAAEALSGRSISRVSIIFFGLKGKDKPKRTTIEIANKEEPAGEKSRGPIRPEVFDETWMRIVNKVEEIFREDQLFGRGENPPCERFAQGCPFLLICPVARAVNEETSENST
jgi:hypothetical protein